MESKSFHELDVYLNGDNDQPTTCPKCGARTGFEQTTEDRQQHQCLSCNYEFFLDFEDEEKEDPNYSPEKELAITTTYIFSSVMKNDTATFFSEADRAYDLAMKFLEKYPKGRTVKNWEEVLYKFCINNK